MSSLPNGRATLQISPTVKLVGEVVTIPSTPPVNMWEFQLVSAQDTGRPRVVWSIPHGDSVVVQARNTLKLGKSCIVLSDEDATEFAEHLGIRAEPSQS